MQTHVINTNILGQGTYFQYYWKILAFQAAATYWQLDPDNFSVVMNNDKQIIIP